MRPTVLLYDIDGTLVTTGGVGRRALEVTFEKLYGRADPFEFRLDGMTDRRIVRQRLENIGEAATAEAIDAVLATYLEVLQAEVLVADMSRYQVHVGMTAALTAS